MLLSRYTHIPVDELRLIAGKNGKPYLDPAQNPNGVSFNFSDSADMALVAVTWNREVGVDVEQIRDVERAREIASRYFPPERAAELEEASESERNRIFLQNWARHEALLKARGGSIWKSGGDNSLFTVHDVDTGQDYVGALAAQGEGWTVVVRDYSD